MTSKQRAYLKGLAMTMDPILQLGKGGLTPENTAAVDEALAARELIKISVLQNCLEDPRQMAEVLAERTRSQIVQVIGKKIVLYREGKTKRKKSNYPENNTEFFMADIKHRIGIMGGTFDPIHMGHLILGEKAYEQFQLEKVLFMPSGNPPHKRNRQGRATDEERVEMVRRAIAGNPHFELSLTEMHENGYTYTYHTLEMLKEKNPDTDYYFIIGADSLYDFDTWREPERICRNCILVTAVRNHSTIAELEAEMNRLSLKYNGTFLTLNTTNLDVSSEMLRNWISEDKSVRYYIPDPVIEYIRENQIYSLTEKKG